MAMATTTPPLRPSTLTYSKTPPALPPADRSNRGALVVTVLSAYDCTSADQPISVSMQVLAQGSSNSSSSSVVQTGPPSARHRDRNSYRFVSSQVLRMEAPLAELYESRAVFTLQYANPKDNLTASLVLKTIHIHETQWLILNLEPAAAHATSSSSTTSSTSTAIAASAVAASNAAPDNANSDNDEPVITPTLRLQVRLEGPYRTEIAALVSACNAWFATMDKATDALSGITNSLPINNLPLSPKHLLIPTVPLVTALVVLSPVLVGVLIVGLPVMLPIVVAVLGVLLGVATVGGVLLASTKRGRTAIGSTLAPMYHTLLSTPSGQCLVYETGPRPTPVSVAKSILPTDLVGKLLMSLALDAMGSATYLIPGVGEVADLVWAPLQLICIMAMYDSVAPNLKYVSFIEEILPFTDVVPSATIGWCTEFGPQLVPALMGGSGGSTTGTSSARTSSNRMNGSSSSSSSALRFQRTSVGPTAAASNLIPPTPPAFRT